LQALVLAAVLLLGPVLFVLAAIGLVAVRVIETVRKSRRSAVLLFMALALAPAIAAAGQNRQETEVDLDASPAAVCAFLEQHVDELCSAGGARVLGRSGNRLRMERDVDGARYEFVLEETGHRGDYAVRLVRTLSGPIIAQQGTLKVFANAEGGAHVSIEFSAEVDQVAPMKIAVELRRNVRGIRRLLEKQFATPAVSTEAVDAGAKSSLPEATKE
jgi:hypothetical protein